MAKLRTLSTASHPRCFLVAGGNHRLHQCDIFGHEGIEGPRAVDLRPAGGEGSRDRFVDRGTSELRDLLRTATGALAQGLLTRQEPRRAPQAGRPGRGQTGSET
ncbi:hypothetical protein [Nocardia flavorosea]|uniref:Uncharacterized protein n=1 Tax=Nocardia flavorosea TaxID=53429 RepID=A0A846YAD0_9NOCA|nr:hypothetical protein [Nocardia flavorosea]NKY54772.1 hypothetical protein [Nocardia flavorosea]